MNSLPTIGDRVKIANRIAPASECGGFLVHQRYIDARRAGSRGTYKGWVPGAGGDIWWVENDDGAMAVYVFNEVELT